MGLDGGNLTAFIADLIQPTNEETEPSDASKSRSFGRSLLIADVRG
jgi:hypothetical protein